jgi:RpiB/LacA/LacB family sugar-phosphate isomerase
MAQIAVGADHAGLSLKEAIKAWLTQHGHRVQDFGTHTPDSVDYPDFAAAVAGAVRSGTAERGVLVCGTGIGMAIAANKVPGIRAVVAPDVPTARISREHNDTNVLALGGRTTTPAAAVQILETWLTTDFAGGRHTQRVAKMAELDGSRPRSADGPSR